MQSYEEGVLDGVLCVGAVAQEAEGQGVEWRPVAFEQYPEARGVAALGRPCELCVTRHRGLLCSYTILTIS